MIRNWHPFDVVDLQPSSSKLQPSNEAIGVDWCVRPSRFLTFVGRRRRRGEGGGCRDIRAGYERVLQEVQNVIFDIPKSFQLIKAPAPSGFKRPRQPERLLEVAPSRYISAKRVGWATLGKHRASGVIWIEFNIRSLFKISSTSLESRRRSCSWMLKIMIVRDLVG